MYLVKDQCTARAHCHKHIFFPDRSVVPNKKSEFCCIIKSFPSYKLKYCGFILWSNIYIIKMVHFEAVALLNISVGIITILYQVLLFLIYFPSILSFTMQLCHLLGWVHETVGGCNAHQLEWILFHWRCFVLHSLWNGDRMLYDSDRIFDSIIPQ